MVIQGSIHHTYSGRKKKKLKSSRKKQPEFVPLERSKASFTPAWWVDTKKEYKSAPFKPYVPRKIDDSYKKEVSSKYTVSIAYNKGTYQVISNQDVEHIGK